MTPKSWKDMWLNEGFATYAEWIWAEDFEGTPAQESFEAAFDAEENWEFAPADPPSAAQVSDAPVYYRGAMVLHKLRQEVGNDVFYEIMQGWAAEHRYGNASTADFTSYVEKKAKKAGKDLDGGCGTPGCTARTSRRIPERREAGSPLPAGQGASRVESCGEEGVRQMLTPKSRAMPSRPEA